MTQALASVGAALGLFLLLVLAVKRPFRRADLWLAAWLVVQVTSCSAVLVAGASPPGAAMIAALVGQLAMIAAGPAHYLYAATVCDGGARRPRHMALCAGIGALIILALPWAVAIRAERGALVADLTTPWLLFVPPFLLLLASAYPVAVLRLVTRRRVALKDQLSNLAEYDPSWLQGWAVSILVMYGAVAAAFTSSMLGSWHVDVQIAIALGIQVAHIAYVGQHGLTRSAVFFERAIPAHAGRRVPVDRRQAADDYATVRAVLGHDKPHRSPNLTAQVLADRLGWGAERLTDALRHGGEVTFFDAINAARVDEVQRLALRPENAAVSILVLGHEAGFGSKSAFYEAFRRHAGCTPAAWRRVNTVARTSEAEV